MAALHQDRRAPGPKGTSDFTEAAFRYYAEPKADAGQIKGHVAFWKGVQVS